MRLNCRYNYDVIPAKAGIWSSQLKIRGPDFRRDDESKGKHMKKIFLILVMLVPVVFAACSKTCETEPIVEENHKLIVPPNFGAKPVK